MSKELNYINDLGNNIEVNGGSPEPYSFFTEIYPDYRYYK